MTQLLRSLLIRLDPQECPRDEKDHLVPVIMVRHGSTDLNLGGNGAERTRGWLNIPLAPQGHEEAQQAAELTKQFPNVKAIVSSDLDRASTTAQYISRAHPGVPVFTTPILRPWNVGNLTGEIYAQAKPILNQHLQNPDQKIPGGESFYDFAGRTLPLLQRLAESPQNTIVVSHNWNIKLIRAMEASKGAELDHAVMAQPNPVKPGHLLHADADYALTHLKPGDTDTPPGAVALVKPGQIQDLGGPPSPRNGAPPQPAF